MRLNGSKLGAIGRLWWAIGRRNAGAAAPTSSGCSSRTSTRRAGNDQTEFEDRRGSSVGDHPCSPGETLVRREHCASHWNKLWFDSSPGSTSATFPLQRLNHPFHRLNTLFRHLRTEFLHNHQAQDLLSPTGPPTCPSQWQHPIHTGTKHESPKSICGMHRHRASCAFLGPHVLLGD